MVQRSTLRSCACAFNKRRRHCIQKGICAVVLEAVQGRSVACVGSDVLAFSYGATLAWARVPAACGRQRDRAWYAVMGVQHSLCGVRL